MLEDEPIYITTIDCWCNFYKSLTGIRITLSNGMQSEIFVSESDKEEMVTLKLVEGNRPKTLTFGCYGTTCRSFKFTDANGLDVLKWVGKPGGDQTPITLEDNELIVGIYGRKTAGFTRAIAFSFITATYKRK